MEKGDLSIGLDDDWLLGFNHDSSGTIHVNDWFIDVRTPHKFRYQAQYREAAHFFTHHQVKDTIVCACIRAKPEAIAHTATIHDCSDG